MVKSAKKKPKRKKKIVGLPQLMRDHLFEPPELPKKMIWTSSSLKLFRKCKRKFFWKHIMRLHSKSTSPALIIGSAFHEALGEWYRGRRSNMKKIAARHQQTCIDEIETQSNYYDANDLDKLTHGAYALMGMLLAYGELYQHERNEWTIDRKNIERRFTLDMGDFDLSGKLDLHMSHGKKRKKDVIVEHKTASSITEGYMDRLPLDTQVRCYVYGSIHAFGLKPNYVLYDVVKKTKLKRKANESSEDYNERIKIDYMSRPDFYFMRDELKFNKSDLDCFVHDVRQTHAEYMQIINERDWRDPRSWVPTDTTCYDFFKKCENMQLCTIGLDRGTAILYDQIDDLHVELGPDE